MVSSITKQIANKASGFRCARADSGIRTGKISELAIDSICFLNDDMRNFETDLILVGKQFRP